MRDFSDQPGFVSTGKRFVRYAENIELLADSLLGKTVIVGYAFQCPGNGLATMIADIGLLL